MLAVLPVVLALLLYWLFRLCGNSWRESFVYAAASFGVAVTCFTEGLSLFQSLTRTSLVLVYLVASMAVGMRIMIKRRNAATSGEMIACDETAQGSAVPASPLFLSLEGALVAGVAIIAAMVGVAALLAPPNTWDAMSYHMPRIVFWMQHRGLAFYPTGQIPQLYMPPWAEYAMLHLHSLSGGDRFDNFVQWFAFCGSAVAASFAAALLGGDRRIQVIAALVCATIPQSILAASGAKNDQVLSFWLICLACLVLVSRTRCRWGDTAAIGSTLGLALLTKGTAYILSVPLILLALMLLGPRNLWNRRRHLIIAAAIVVVLNTGQWVRNLSLFGKPLGPGTAAANVCPFSNERLSGAIVLSNIVRNVAIQLSTPNKKLNTELQDVISRFLRSWNIDPDDPQTCFCGTHFAIPEFACVEDGQGNLLHVLLSFAALVVLTTRRWWTRNRITWLYATVPTFGFVLFCALLRWQPWHTRLHQPLFVLGAPLIAVVLGSWLPQSFTAIFTVGLLLSTVPFLAANRLRPLFIPSFYFAPHTLLEQDRTEFYLAGQPGLLSAYRAVADRVLNTTCRDVGLNVSSNNQIYPLMVMLRADRGLTRIYNLGVTNVSVRYEKHDTELAKPCAIIYLDTAHADFQKYSAPGHRIGAFQDIRLFLDLENSREGQSPANARSTPLVRVAQVPDYHCRDGVLRVDIPRHLTTNGGTFEIMINSTFAGNNACWVQVNRANGTVGLVKDSGDGSLGLLTFGDRSVLKNAQCAVDGARSFVEAEGDEIRVNLHLERTPTFRGTRGIFLNAPFTPDGATEWQTAGVWREFEH
jgi:hypothetical protein